MKHFLYLLSFLILLGCSSTSSIKGKFSKQQFKDRALCNCIALGLDSVGNNRSIQKIVPYDPYAYVLFDSSIKVSLKMVLKEMYLDSIARKQGSSESAQGKPVFNFCMRYYRGISLDKLAKKQVRKANEIKNIDEYISLKFPTS